MLLVGKLKTRKIWLDFVVSDLYIFLEISRKEWVSKVIIQNNTSHKLLKTHLSCPKHRGDPFVTRVGLAHLKDVLWN